MRRTLIASAHAPRIFPVLVVVLTSSVAISQLASVQPRVPMRGSSKGSASDLLRKSVFPQTSASSGVNFLPAVTYATGGEEASFVAVKDVTGDGKPDLIVVNNCNNTGCFSGSVGVMRGNGDGTFSPAVTFDSGGIQSHAVAVVDVNGDGKPDALVANPCDDVGCKNGSVGVLLGDSDTVFKTVQLHLLSGLGAQSIVVADVNGDGKPDLVVATCALDQVGGGCTNQPSVVAILLGNGDGTFQDAQTYSSGGSDATSAAVQDVNADGIPDIVVTNRCAQVCEFDGEGSVSVLFGAGDGTFAAPISYDPGGQDSFSVAVGDVNSDGVPDILVSNNTDVSVLLGNGDGSFQKAATFSSAFGFSLAVADVNNDGKPDLLVADGADSVDVMLGNGDGTFQPPVVYSAAGSLNRSLAVADVNGDGTPDILVANSCGYPGCSPLIGTVSVLVNATGAEGSPTHTQVVSSLNPAFAGQGITFTAFVSSAAGIPPDGESILFNDGQIFLGKASLKAGSASLTSVEHTAGTFTVTATYPGDANFAASVSPGIQELVKSTTKSPTTTSLASSLNPSVYGQKVTFTVAVTNNGGVAPTGRVVFASGANTIGIVQLNSSGVATLTRSNLSAFLYPIVATYKGDSNNLSSTSPALNQVINATTSKATLTSSPNPSASGQAVTFTAKISSPTVTPTGPVTFAVGKTVLGTAQLTGGKAVFTTSSLPLGATVVTVKYLGDSNITGSSASVKQTVE